MSHSPTLSTPPELREDANLVSIELPQYSSVGAGSSISGQKNGNLKNNGDSASNTSTAARIVRRPSILDGDDQPTSAAAAAAASLSLTESQLKSKDEPVTWMSLPKKGQLAIITLARLSEPLAERSLSAYMFYQLRSFDPSLPDGTITSQGGFLTAAFAGAQLFTAVWWGRAADTPWIGRKRVLLVGLFGTAIASIGVGFSKSFYQALCFRALAGALNGNIGVMRTMISEIIQEKKFQSRAFLLLPMCFNIGVVVGPIMGGFLADPVTSFPTVFGPESVLGGKDGVAWMKQFPYGLPNLFSGAFILMSALAVILGLDETHPSLLNAPDYGRTLGNWFRKWLVKPIRRRGNNTYSYTQLSNNDHDIDDSVTSAPLQPYPKPLAGSGQAPAHPQPLERLDSTTSRPGFRSILKRNVLFTLLTHHLMALHVSSFNALIFLFLPSPRSPQPPHHFTLAFTGGLGLSSSNVGLATAVMGLIGFPLQLFFYPPINTRLGTLKGYRLFLPFSALAYATLPFLAILPSTPSLLWSALTLVLAAQVLSRTFALTGSVILINNSSPSPAVLGTLHGVAQTVSSAARMLGPTLGGWGLGLGLKENCVGAVWWAMTLLVGLNWGLLWFIFEGDGHGGRA